MSIRQKGIVFFSKEKKKQKRAVACDPDFRERGSDFSLDFLPFGLSVRFRPKSKVVLHEEGYVLTSIWWSSDNSKR